MSVGSRRDVLALVAAASTRSTRPAGDGWTVATADGGRSAHVEHTIIVARGRTLILTA
jgi:methionyl aminopeptidase